MPPEPAKSVARSRILKKAIGWLMVLSALAVLGWFAFIFTGKALCHIAIGQMADLTNTRISTAKIDFRPDGSVLIRDLAVSPYRKADPDQTILMAEQVFARFDRGSLFTLKPRLRRIDVNDFTFNAQYNLDTGRWNLSALKLTRPKGKLRTMPVVRLQRGTLQYSKTAGGRSKVVASVPLAATLGPDRQIPDAYSFDIKTATQASGHGQSRLTGRWRSGSLTVAGGIASADVPALEMAWTIDVIAAELKYDPNDDYRLDLRIKRLKSRTSPPLERFVEIGPALLVRSTPFRALRTFFSRYRPHGAVDIRLEATGNFKTLADSTISGYVDCNDVSIHYEKFPYTVEHIKGRVDFTDEAVTLKNLSGKHGDVRLFFNGWTCGFAPDWEYDIRITSPSMPFDADLYQALSDRQKRFWSAYSPRGRAALDYHIARNSAGQRTKRLDLDLQNVDATYRGFVYPLRNLTGRLRIESDTLSISNVASEYDGRRIVLNGSVKAAGTSQSGYDLSVEVQDIPLDATLEAALPDRQKDLFSQFSPTGTASGRIRISKAPSERASFEADLSFNGGTLRSEQLPLPVTDITATAVFAPERISIKSFSGRYAGKEVSMAGKVWPDANDRPARYDLLLKFTDATLDEDLFALVPQAATKTVADFKPRGNIDLTAHLKKLGADGRTSYNIELDCRGNSVVLPHFGYPLQDVTGKVVITPDSIELKDINAVPGDAVLVRVDTACVKMNGNITLLDNAFGGAMLDVAANDIFLDRWIGSGLPAGMRPLYDKLLSPSRFDADFKNLRIRLNEEADMLVELNGLLRLENCSFKVSGATTRIDAPMNVTGLYKIRGGFETCSVFLDHGTLEVLGKTFHDLTGHIDYDKGRRAWTSRDIRARCYGGELVGSLELLQPEGAPPEYVLQTGFHGVDLKRFLSATRLKSNAGDDHTAGKMAGTLGIAAQLGDSSTRVGACKLSIIEMQVGRVSPLAKLLQVLRFKKPTEFAFERMLVDSYIRRNDLVVHKLDLSGQSVAFYGSGSMDLTTREVALELIARGRRAASQDPSVLGSLAEGLGQGLVKIEVSGDFYDPQVKTRPLPFIKGTLEILGKPIEPR